MGKGTEEVKETDPELLTTKQLAYRWKMSPETLRRWRFDGKGPKHFRRKVNGYYRMEDIIKWEKEHEKTEEEKGQRFMTPVEVAKKFDISISHLSGLRYTGKGPKFIKFDSIILYRFEDVNEWHKNRKKKLNIRYRPTDGISPQTEISRLEIARQFGISEQQLLYMRRKKTGPKCFRRKGIYIYRLEEVEKWVKEQETNRNEYLTTEQLSSELNMAPHTLSIWRSNGRGPKFFRYGGRVLYKKDDIEKWKKEQIITLQTKCKYF